MGRTARKMIKDTLPLADCAEGDEVHIQYSLHGSWKNVGWMRLRKMKRLADGSLQVKCRGTMSTDTVRKVVVPGDLVVDRRRPADARDADRIVVVEPEMFEHEGVAYAVTDTDADVERIKRRLALEEAAATRPPDNEIRHLGRGRVMGPLDVLGIEGGILEVGAAIARSRSRHIGHK